MSAQHRPVEDILPVDVDAERGVVGAPMYDRHVLGHLARTVTPDDFMSQACAATWRAILELWRDGHDPNVVAVIDHMRTHGTLDPAGGQNGIIAIYNAGAPGQARRLANVVIDRATRRKVILAAQQAQRIARDLDCDDPLRDAQAALAGIDFPVGEEPPGMTDSEELADLVITHTWLVPGLLGDSDRLLLVGPEGAGKSWIARQIAVLCAAGVHPFDLQPIDPVETLIVDLENPTAMLQASMAQLHGYTRRIRRPGKAHFWHQQAGIDLRTRRDRHYLEAIIMNRRPRLLVLGPLYKAYRVAARESDELAAGEVQAFLDDLRGRYGVAVVLEHHAPKAQGGSREWTPYGSSVWLRWPEYGRNVSPARAEDCKTGGTAGVSLKVGKFRGDRRPVHWPERLDRGASDGVPWLGFWPDGMYRGEAF